jgi:drug/metabolite transporter (DMT)-like permease
MAHRQRLTLLLALATVYIVWGSTFFAIRIAAHEIPSLTMVGTRFVAAGLALLLFQRVRGKPLPILGEWRRALPIGVLLFVGGNGMVVIAEANGVASGTAAMVNATIPLWVAALGALFASSRPTRREIVGIVLGAAGALLLASGGDVWLAGPTAVLALVAAPLCWSIGTLLVRRAPPNADPLSASALQMLTGGGVALVAAGVTGERMDAMPSVLSSAAWVYLLVFGSIAGFSAYSWLVKNTRSAVATSYAFVNPVIAVVLGTLMGNEAITWRLVVAAPLVLASLALVLRVPSRAPSAAESRQPIVIRYSSARRSSPIPRAAPRT